MPTFLASPVDLSPTADHNFNDVDLSAHLPVGATGVLLQFDNTSVSALYPMARCNGSTDDFSARGTYSNEKTYWLCGVDENRVIELHRDDAAVTIYLYAYFGQEARFFTNAVIKTLSTPNVWEDVDISANLDPGDSAIAAMLQIVMSNSYTWGVRKNGSSDNRLKAATSACFALVGVDGANILEANVSNVLGTFPVIGYLKSGGVLNTDANDRSLGSTGSYADLTALPAGARSGVYEITSGVLGQAYGLRKNGSALDNYDNMIYHRFEIVECDENQLVEGKISATGVDFFEMGYFDADPILAAGQAPITRAPMWGRF